jgi:predicted permease
VVGYSLRQDVWYTLRGLRQSPLFATVVTASLTLGIGANTTIFTLADAILLRSLPVPNPQELVVLARNPSRPTTGGSYPDYCYLRDRSRSYAGLIAFWSGGLTSFRLLGEGSAQMAALALVSGNYFETLGVLPAAGRMLNAEDNKLAALPYVVLSHAFWKSRLGGDERVVGRDILLNGTHFTVAGVARQGFTGTSVGTAPDVFAPILRQRTFWPDDANALTTRDAGWITFMGRLKPGVSRAQAAAELNVLWRQILENDPEERAIKSQRKEYDLINTRLLLPGSSGTSDLQKDVRWPLTILMIASAFVLLIASANVATLLLARGTARRREIAVRLAVGAARNRIVVQMLTESITLSVIGGVAGLVLARVGIRILIGFLPVETWSPLDLDVAPDIRLFTFALSVMVGSGILFGLAPALRASQTDLVQALKSSGSSSGASHFARWDLSRALVSLQVALSLVLLAGAGLFTRTLANLRSVDAQTNYKNLIFIDTNIIQAGFPLQRACAFHEHLREEVERLAGVQSATTADMVPFADSHYADYVQTDAFNEPALVSRNAVAPRFFEVLGIAILRGRDFRHSEPQRVAIVNEAFARRFFGGQSAIERRVCFGQKWDAAQTYEIVGLVADAHYGDLRKPVEPAIYRPRYYDNAWTGGTLCVRTTGDPRRVLDFIRKRVREIEPAVMVTQERTLEDNLDRTLLQEHSVATLGSFFGLVSLMLVAVGLYGVMSQSVTARTKDIGIRMALGAQRSNILWMVLWESAGMITFGLLLGLPLALEGSRLVSWMIFGLAPNDPATLLTGTFVLIAVGFFAGLLPALRASGIDPSVAIRDE